MHPPETANTGHVLIAAAPKLSSRRYGQLFSALIALLLASCSAVTHRQCIAWQSVPTTVNTAYCCGVYSSTGFCSLTCYRKSTSSMQQCTSWVCAPGYEEHDGDCVETKAPKAK